MSNSTRSLVLRGIWCLAAGSVLLPLTTLAGEPDQVSGRPSLSSDGRFVVFQSDATNFVSEGGISNANYVYDRDTGQTTRPVNASSSAWVSTSAGARFISFHSHADFLVPDDTNRNEDVFVHDRAAAQTTRVSVRNSGMQVQGRSTLNSISDDGRYVAFESVATGLVAGDITGTSDVFLHDRETGRHICVSVDNRGIPTYNSTAPDVNADARFVAYTSYASNLVAGDTNGAGDVYLYDRETGVNSRVSVGSSGVEGNAGSYAASVSADGRFVVFVSSASNLVPDDTNGVDDVFVRDRAVGTTSRVSVDSSGIQGNGPSGNFSGQPISRDGRFVAFGSNASNLVADDVNGAADVFVHDRQTGETTLASISSTGSQGDDYSGGPSMSADGLTVAFESQATNLAEGLDLNGVNDVFVHDRVTGRTMRVEPQESDDVPLTSWLRVQGGVTAVGNEIRYDGSPRGWWNGAYSPALSSLGYGEQFEVRFRVDSEPGGTTWTGGIGFDETGTHWSDPELAFRSTDGVLSVREDGIWRTGGIALAVGDVLAIRVNDFGSRVQFRHNGARIYESLYVGWWHFTNSVNPMYVDTAFRDGPISLSVSVAGPNGPPTSGYALTSWFGAQGGVTTRDNQISFDGSTGGSVNSVALSTLGFIEHFDRYQPTYDGYDDSELLFSIDSNPRQSTWVVGLGAHESNAGMADVEYGLRSDDGVLSVRENGTWRAGGTHLSIGDVISMQVGIWQEGRRRVEYRHNGVPLYTTFYDGSPSLYVDTSFEDGPMVLSASLQGKQNPVQPSEPITTWSSETGGITTNGNRISFSGAPTGWHSTVNSSPLALSGFDDDYEVLFTIDTDPRGTTWIVGFGTAEAGTDPADIEFGLRSSDGSLEVRENGSWQKGGARLSQGDTISVLISNGSIEYRHNGVPIHATAHEASPHFYIDSSFHSGAVGLSVSVVDCVTDECLDQ